MPRAVQPAPRSDASALPRAAVLTTLWLMYTAQGLPLGLAAEYLPVVLRRAHFTRTQIAALSILQLPWQLKMLWAHVADRPAVQRHSRTVLLVLELALAASIALYAPFDPRTHLRAWFWITPVCALLAATQDVFVDALAVRSLGARDRGLGNVAQVVGYRLGMLIGGGGVLLVIGSLGTHATFLACAAVVAVAGAGVFALRGAGSDDAVRSATVAPPAPRVMPLLRNLFARASWPVLALAVTYKLGAHIASALIKPMAVDAGWSNDAIGWAVVTVGTVAGIVGAACGGIVHRVLGEARALVLGAVCHALVCAPLIVAARLGVPHGLTTVAIAADHFASGLGTTVLFAALMTATRRSSAGMHYTILTSANALALWIGSVVGSALADARGVEPALVLAAVASLAPLALIPRWTAAAAASSAEPAA